MGMPQAISIKSNVAFRLAKRSVFSKYGVVTFMASQKVNGANRIPRHIITVDIITSRHNKGMMVPFRVGFSTSVYPSLPKKKGEANVEPPCNTLYIINKFSQQKRGMMTLTPFLLSQAGRRGSLYKCLIGIFSELL
jgi:hypothetical protein